MLKCKVKIGDLYSSLLNGRTTYFDLIHKSKEGSEIKFSDLKETHIRNIIKILKKDGIFDVDLYLEFDLVDFSNKGQILKLVKNQVIDIKEIKSNYYNNMMY